MANDHSHRLVAIKPTKKAGPISSARSNDRVEWVVAIDDTTPADR